MGSPEDTFTGRVKRVHKTPEFDWIAKLIAATIVSVAAAWGTISNLDAHKDEKVAKGYERIAALEGDVRKLEAELDETRTKLYEAIRRERDTREAKDVVLEGRLWQIWTGKPAMSAPGLTEQP